jgi:hypothetical protein
MMLGVPDPKGATMRRSLTFTPLLVLTAALLSPGAAATGAPPAPVDTTETFAAGEACPFPIEVVTEGKSGFVDLPNNPELVGIGISPGLRVTVTNLSDPSNTITVNATGAFRFITTADGGLEIRAGGRNFLYGVPEVGATALATTGPIEVQVANGEIIGMDLSGARVRDLCEELA